MRGAATIQLASIILVSVTVADSLQGQSTAAGPPSSRSSLARAIWNGDLTTVRRLLASGADPREPDDQGAPPFLEPWEVAVVAGNNEAFGA